MESKARFVRGDTVWRVQIRTGLTILEEPIVHRYTVSAAGQYNVSVRNKDMIETRYTRREAERFYAATETDAILYALEELRQIARQAQATVDTCMAAAINLSKKRPPADGTPD